MAGYQPKTGAECFCKRGVQRDNCPTCEGTGWQIDFRAIRARRESDMDMRVAAGDLWIASEPGGDRGSV